MLNIDSFRNRLLILFAGLAFILGLCITLYIGYKASAQMTAASAQTLNLVAKGISTTLANSLTEREREMLLLSESPFFMETDFKDEQIQLKLDQVKQSYKYYAWLGIANPQGEVTVAADGMLQGADVSSRPWFKEGLKRVYLGDVHEAVLLAKKLKAINPNEPMRFIDFATPIYDAKSKQLRGVLAAHADWSWASQVMQSALPEDAAEKGIEVFIANSKSEILYPYKSIGQVTLPENKTASKTYFIDDWHEGVDYLTTDVPVISDTKMSLGWHVIIRQPVSAALANVRATQKQIALIGFVVALFMLIITYRLANRFSRPIEELAQRAYSVERGQDDVHFEAKTSIKEIQGLSRSLNSMTTTLLSQKHQLQEANTTLEQKVQERTAALKEANLELEKLAHYDGLTGLHNRRAFNDYQAYLFEQFQRQQQPYAILLMDVDFFKKVNDSFGHEMGDHVLQSVASLLAAEVRSTDFVARFGGEEFIVLLPVTALDGALLLAEKIRCRIENEKIIEHYAITVSIGVSAVLPADQTANEAIRRADQNLYRAKEQGRNRVVASKE